MDDFLEVLLSDAVMVIALLAGERLSSSLGVGDSEYIFGWFRTTNSGAPAGVSERLWLLGPQYFMTVLMLSW